MTTNTQHGPEPEPAAAPPDPDTEPAVPGGWSALVYGRTLQVDQWWRALPAGVDRQGPVADAVRAAVAGGNRLEAGPRFLLHRDARGVLVGAACELGRISRTMVHDRFGRPLYGFVGWYRAAAPDAAYPTIPELAELTANLADWAGPVYTEWIAPTWEAVGREEAEPRTTRPVAAPWHGAPAPSPTAAVWLPAHSAGTHLLPESDADALWSAAAGAARDRCLLATGWRRRSDAEAHRFTHLTSADCRAYELLRPPPPPPRPAPPRPVPVVGPGPAGGPTGSGGATGGSWGSEGTGDPDSSLAETFRAGRRALRRMTRGLFGAEESGAAEPPTSPGSQKPPGAGGRRYGDDPVTGRRYYGDLDEASAGPTQPPARPTQPDGAHPASTGPAPTGPASTGPASTAPRPTGSAAPGRRAEATPFRRTRAVDPQQADLSGMFGEFDEPVPPPPDAPPAGTPSVAPSDPQRTRSEAPDLGPTDDSATGEPS